MLRFIYAYPPEDTVFGVLDVVWLTKFLLHSRRFEKGSIIKIRVKNFMVSRLWKQ